MAAVVAFLLVASLIPFASSASLPKSWQRCHQSDPNLNKCLQVAVIDAIRKMENKGVPSLGVFPIDPLDVEEMNLIEGNGSPIGINLGFKKLKILGIAKSSITEYDAQLKNYSIFARSMTPAFVLRGGYEMNGRILLLPITGKGQCNITLEELDVNHYLTGRPLEVDGKVYMKLSDYRITFNPKRFIAHFDNLFNGDKLLGETMNKFLADNWKAVFPELRPSLELTFGAMFKEMSNRIFTKVPMDEIFLP